MAVKQSSTNGRVSFAKLPEILDVPALLDIQRRSYERCLQQDTQPDKRESVGIQAVFEDMFPIESYDGVFSLEFISYEFGPPKHSIDECKRRGLSYGAPLHAKLRLVVREPRATMLGQQFRFAREQSIYLGEVPLMTKIGTFVINGSERVIVSQLHRSPGVIFNEDEVKDGKRLYSSRIIPYRGSWLEIQFDVNDVLHVSVDRRRKLLLTVFLRAWGWETDAEIISLFYRTRKYAFVSEKEVEYAQPMYVGKPKNILGKTSAEDVSGPDGTLLCSQGDEITKDHIHGFEAHSVTDVSVLARSRIDSLIGTPELPTRLADDVIDPQTGEVLAESKAAIDEELLERFLEAGVREITTVDFDPSVDDDAILRTLDKDVQRSQEDALLELFKRLRPGNPPNLGSAKSLFERMFCDPKRYDMGMVGRYKLNQKTGLDTPLSLRVLQNEDIIAVIKSLIALKRGESRVDDIDHLGNRRIRCVGELLENQVRLGLVRMERNVRERMSLQDPEEANPQNLVNPKPIISAVRDFFGRGQLSQFMDQVNPLAELTHKRRLSALGPGGLSRERAGFDVRDVHPSHYGRVCPVETPEGPNIGLITSLATYARVNDLGFLETPYQKVVDGKVLDEMEYLTADQEDHYIIAQASAEVDRKGNIVQDQVMARFRGNSVPVGRELVQYKDVSPTQLMGISASLIPFLEHDDANRALMGSNMQRQAVPLLRTEAPLVGTGMEGRVARGSNCMVVSQHDGVVENVSADHVLIKTKEEDGNTRFVSCSVEKFQKSNQGTCLNQKVLVDRGMKIKKGDVIADGPGTQKGELALGRNILVAFMPWRGYNFEDAIAISESMAKTDAFTSVHLEEFEIQARDTKIGAEEITRDIPNVGETALSDLDEDGIVRIGAEVRPGDILVGKIAPRTESELNPEERLLRAIFGSKAEEVQDASLRVPPGVTGVVVDVEVFTRRKETGKKRRPEEQAEIEQAAEWAQLQENKVRETKNKALKELIVGRKAREDLLWEDGGVVITKGQVITEARWEELCQELDLSELPLSEEVQEQVGAVLAKMEAELEKIERERVQRLEKFGKGADLPPGVNKMVRVYVASKRKLSVGDKMAGRHGNKGVIAKIVPEEDMPFLEDGTPVEIVLNPLGVPSRMNVGQVLETHLGWAARVLGLKVMTPIFNGATEEEIKDLLKEADLPSNGKTTLRDGLTGEAFDQLITVGYIYMMKLEHLVSDKMHARSTGPYSLVTQQPLGGKAQFGGQRLGEMEVWALEAYGAAYTLQELLTVKSDDVAGRSRAYEAIVKGKECTDFGTPESFNVLVKELRGLGFNVIFDRGMGPRRELNAS